MPSCVVPTCKNAVGLKKKQDGITFHVFPADEERKAVWTKIIQRARLEQFWTPSKRSVVCSMHFENKYIYETKCGLKRLKKEAFPNKHLAIIVEEAVSCMEKSKNAKQLHSPAKSNSEIGDVKISDLEYLFDSPKKAKLISQLRHKQIICRKHVRRIKTLQQKNRRLVKKNESLKGILRNLKNNRYVNDDVYDQLLTNVVAADIFNNVYQKCVLKKKKPKYNAKIK